VKQIFVILNIIILLSSKLQADQFFTGYSMFNTYTAKTLPLGYMQISTQGRIFSKSKAYSDGNNLVNATGLIGVNFGYNNNLEMGANLTFYQDINRNAALSDDKTLIDTNIPDATYLRIKYRGNGWEFGNKYFGLWAVASSFKYISKEANVILEPYSSQSMQINLTGIFSFYFDQLYMEEGQSAHLNLGYILHNDAPRYESMSGLTDGAMEFTYALGYKYPIGYFDLNLEMNGNAMFNMDSTLKKTHYSTEPYIYATPSIKYKAFAGLDFDLGCDVLLYTTYAKYSETPSKESPSSIDLPYYAPWRVLMRMNYTPSTPYVDIPTFSSASSVKNRVSNSRQVSSRRELFEWLIEEPDRVEYIDMKLDKLRNERKAVEESINKIKNDMDGGNTETTP